MKGTVCKEIRSWTADDVRALCIRESLYTRGTNEQYDRMLQSVIDTPHPELIAIVDVAENICDHSDWPTLYGCSKNQAITKIANMLANDVVKVHFEIEIQ